MLATFDPISALAATDAAQLDALLREVQTGEAAVQEMLAELAAGAGLYADAPLVLGDGDVVDKGERAGSSPWERVQASGKVRCLVGDVEFGLPKEEAATWLALLEQQEAASLREAAEEWFCDALRGS